MAQCLECARADVQGHEGVADARGRSFLEHCIVEMQARRRRCHGSGFTGINGLVALVIRGLRLALEVGRQRHLAMRVKIRQQRRREIQPEELAIASGHRRSHAGRKLQPRSLAGCLAGTHLRDRLRLSLQPLDQHFAAPAGFLAAAQPRVDHARIIKYEQIAWPQQQRQVREAAIAQLVANLEQAARTSRVRRMAGNQLPRQLVVEVGNLHRRAW